MDAAEDAWLRRDDQRARYRPGQAISWRRFDDRSIISLDINPRQISPFLSLLSQHPEYRSKRRPPFVIEFELVEPWLMTKSVRQRLAQLGVVHAGLFILDTEGPTNNLVRGPIIEVDHKVDERVSIARILLQASA